MRSPASACVQRTRCHRQNRAYLPTARRLADARGGAVHEPPHKHPAGIVPSPRRRRQVCLLPTKKALSYLTLWHSDQAHKLSFLGGSTAPELGAQGASNPHCNGGRAVVRQAVARSAHVIRVLLVSPTGPTGHIRPGSQPWIPRRPGFFAVARPFHRV